MKRLILLRHAKSSWADPGLSDFERPLSPRGERDGPQIAERLAGSECRPDAIVSSSARRAQRTAGIIARAVDYPSENIELVMDLYLASAANILAVVSAAGQRSQKLLVVGHNPGLTELINRLLPDFELDNLPTAGVVAIDFDSESWAGLETTERRLVYYDYPKNLGPPLIR